MLDYCRLSYTLAHDYRYMYNTIHESVSQRQPEIKSYLPSGPFVGLGQLLKTIFTLLSDAHWYILESRSVSSSQKPSYVAYVKLIE